MNLPADWNLPAAIRERLGERPGRQRAMVAEGHLLLILHRAPGPDQPERQGILFWRLPDGQWKSSAGEGGLDALNTHLDSFRAALEAWDETQDTARDAAAYFQVLEAVTPLHRSAKNLHATLQSAREALPEARELITLRDTANDLERFAELLLADAKNGLDFQNARKNEEQAAQGAEMARLSHKLNLLAALFLPLTAVTSIFGMSLRSGLEHAPPSVYWAIVFFGAILGFVLRGFVSR